MIRPALTSIEPEAELNAVVQALGDLILVLDAEGRFLKVTTRLPTLAGYTPAEFVGLKLADVLPIPEAGTGLDLIQRCLATQAIIEYEFAWRGPRGAQIIFCTLLPLSPESVMCVARNITEARRAENLAQIQQRILELIATGQDFETVLVALVRAVEERLPGILCSVLLVTEDGQHLTTAAAPSLPPGYNAAVNNTLIGPQAGSCGTAAYRRELVIVTDIEQDPLWVDHREAAHEHGLRACWSKPILATDNKLLGTFAMYYREPRSPDAYELTVIETASQLASIAIERRQAEADLRRAVNEERARAAEVDAIRIATLGLTRTLEFPRVLDELLQAVCGLMPVIKDVHLYLYDAEHDQLSFGSAMQAGGKVMKPWKEPRRNGLAHTVASSGQVVQVSNMNTHPLYRDVPDHWGGALVGFPLKIGGQVVGVMNVAYAQPREFPPAELERLALLADQAALAIENARLFSAERSARAEAEALQQVTNSLLTFSLDRAQVLQLILDQLARVVDYDSASIMLIDRGELTMTAHRGLRADVQFSISKFELNSMEHLKTVVAERRPLIIGDTHLAPSWQRLNEPKTEYIRCWLGVPLVVKDVVIGIFNLDKEQAHFYTARHAQLVAAFANQAAIAIEHARLYEALAQEAQRLDLLNQLGRDLTARLDPEPVYAAVHRAAMQLMPCDTFSIAIVSETGQEVRLVYLVDKGKRYPVEVFPIHRGLTGQVIASGKSLRMDNLDQFENREVVRFGDPDHVKSLLTVPMLLGQRVVGTLSAQSYVEYVYTDAEERTLSTLAHQAAIAIENARLYDQTQSQLHDQILLYECAHALSLVHDVMAAMTIGAEYMTARFNATSLTFYSYDEETLTCRVDYEYWTDKASERERRPVAGQTINLSRYPLVQLALKTRLPQLMLQGDTGLTQSEAEALAAFDGQSLMAVPMVSHDQVVGFFEIWNSHEPYRYTERDRRLLMALSTQVTIALDNSQLYAETKRQSLELETLLEAARAVSSFQKLEDVITLLARKMAQATYAVGCTISKWDKEAEAVVTWVTWREREREYADTTGTVYPLKNYPTTRKALETKTPHLVTVTDIYADPSELKILQDGHLTSLFMTPLAIGDEVIGLVEVYENSPVRQFALDEINLIQGMVSQAAIAIANAQLFEAVALEKQRLELLYDLSQSLATTLSPQEVGDRALARMCPTFGAFQGAVYILNPRTNRLHLSSLTNANAERIATIDRNMDMHVGEGLSGQVAHKRSPVVIDDVTENPDWIPVPDLDEQVTSLIAAPLISSNQLVGVINLSSQRKAAFRQEQLPLMIAAATPVAAALHNARLFAETQRTADAMREASTILHALNASPEVSQAFPAVAQGLQVITECARVSLALFNEAKNMVTIAALDQPRAELDTGVQFPAALTAAADDVLAGRPHFTRDLAAETQFPIEARLYEAGHRSRVNIPLRVGQRVIGAVNLVWTHRDGFNELNFELMTQIADAVALAIEKDRFFTESRRRDAILESLAYGSQRLLMPGNLNDNMASALANLGQVIGVSRVYVFENQAGPQNSLIAVQRHEWRAPTLVLKPGERVLTEISYDGVLEGLGQVLGASKPFYGLVRDLPAEVQEVLSVIPVRSIAIVPIFSGGRWWGFLGLDDCEQERAWVTAEIESLRNAAATLGAAFARQQSEAAEREQRTLAEALRDSASALNSTLNFDEVIDRILDSAGRVVEHDAVNVLLLDEKKQEVYLARRSGFKRHPNRALGPIRMPISMLPNLQQMVQTKRPFVIPDTSIYPGWVVSPETEWVRSYMGAPIIIRGQVAGFLNLDSMIPNFFNEGQAWQLMAFANEAAIAMHNAQLFAATERHGRNVTLLNEITRAALEATDFANGLQPLAYQLGRLVNADGCYITLWDDVRQQPIPTAAYGAFQADYPSTGSRSEPGEASMTSWVLKAGHPIIVHDLRHTNYLSQRLLADYEGYPLESVLTLPLTVGDRKLGAVIVSFAEHHEFAEDEVAICEQAAGQVALAIFKSQLIEDEREQRSLAEALRDTASALGSTLNFDDVLERVLQNVGRVVPHEAATIWLSDNPPQGIDPHTGSVRVMGTHGYAERGLEGWVMALHTTVANMPLMQQMVAMQEPIIVFDTQAEPNWVAHPETQWIRSLVGAPIRMRGWVIGSINLNSTEPHFFTKAHAERLQAFADQAAIAIENAFLYDSIRQSADELSILYRASAQLIRPGADVETISMQMVSLLTEEFRIEHCAVYVHDEAANALTQTARSGSEARRPSRFLAMKAPTLVTAAMQQARVLHVTGSGLSEQYHDLAPDSKSAIAAPMSVGGRIIGVLNLESSKENAFDMRTQRMVAAFAERAGLALENTQLLTRLDFARQTAEEASKLKSEFLANTSHELRTPLTGIIASLSMVLDNLCDSPEEEREFIQIAYSSSEHLHEIINSVLDIAKIEAGRMDVDLRAVDIAAMFSEVYTMTRVQADDRALKLEMRLPDDLTVRVLADPDKLRQILINLIGNSIKFTEKGAIRVQAENVGEQMVITVQDTGIGISADKQARLFQPFVQGDGSMTRKYGGTGLGLSISRRFAEMMGGSLTLFSEGVGKGTVLTLLLPLARQPV